MSLPLKAQGYPTLQILDLSAYLDTRQSIPHYGTN